MIYKKYATEFISLLTPYFRCPNNERQRELDECLMRNAENPLIERIVLLIDDGAPLPLESAKIEIRHLAQRPTYSDWLGVVDDMNLQGPVVLANSDIYFDETIGLLHDVLHDQSVFMALSRWEIDGTNIFQHPNPHWSQDVWAISAGNLDLRKIRERLGFKLGVPRCDNKIAYVFATSGWSVRNPCNFVRSYHLHETQSRKYDKKSDTTIVGGVAYVEPSEAIDRDSALHFEIWSVKSHEVVKVSVNNSLEKWRLESAAPDISSRHAAPRLDQARPTPPSDSRLDLFCNGERVFSNNAGMAVFEKGPLILAVPCFDPRKWSVLKKAAPVEPDVAARFFGPVIDEHLKFITERPEHEDDVNFWQYPCRSEKQASLNHLSIGGPRIDHNDRTIKLYVPLRWATYIDNKRFPKDVLKDVADRLAFLAALAERLGYTLETHTVCQHIRWRNMVENAERLGITDLSISHCTTDTRAEMADAGTHLRVHPWSLYAVNYSDKTRNAGLIIGKPMNERKYLASFIGAHMPHYLSDIRVRLYEGLAALEAEDIVIDLGNMWHFNQVVYDHQVKIKHADETMPVDLGNDTRRYNQTLSDSKFSLCPAGAGPNTLRFWESIAVGSVPVLLDRSLEFPEKVDAALKELCVFWEGAEHGKSLYDWLKSFPVEDLERRSRELRKIYAMVEKLTCF